MSKLRQKATLGQVVQELEREFECPAGEIENDVCDFVEVLLKRGVVREAL